ncbi:MAG: glycosyltransferase [Deltaproteobacteria bacterium]|nr:glycosyltransferase [Deltaproteobacteria bacterium]
MLAWRFMARPSLSLCMIVKNEEATLGACLDSVAGLVDELVVVDTGSTDGTRELVRSRGGRLLERTFDGDFSDARNAGLEAVTADWILVLDADEALEVSSRAKLGPLLDDAGADAFTLTVRNLAPEGELATYEDLRLTRLFRRHPAYRYEGTIHEQVRPAIERAGGRIRSSELLVLHRGYAQPTAQGESRVARNLALLEAAVARAPAEAYLHYQLGATLKALGRFPEARAALERALELGGPELGPSVLDGLQMKLAQLHTAAGEHAAALRAAEESLRHNAENVISHNLAALAAVGIGDHRRALEHFVAVRRSPATNPAHAAQLDALIAYCRRAAGSCPGDGNCGE